MYYDNYYVYKNEGNPYAVDLIKNHSGSDEYFEWDKKGNMITHYDEINDDERRFS